MAAATDTAAPPIDGEAIVIPDADEPGGLELVYEEAASDDPVSAPPPVADVIVVPRYAVYLQGGLLALVSFVAFSIGILMGSTFVVPSSPAKDYRLMGTVTWLSGPRSRPDVGAVVVVIPLTPRKLELKVPVAGLRSIDPPPAADSKALTILRQFGGDYARADASGRFRIAVPSPGRYLVLVVSRERAARFGGEHKAAEIALLGEYFDDPAELLADRRYQLKQELIRGDREHTIQFD